MPPMPPATPDDDESLGSVLRRRVERLLGELAGARIEGVYPVVMREVECSLLQTVLAHTQGHKEHAAQILGLHRNSLRLRLRATGLETAPARRRRRKGARP